MQRFSAQTYMESKGYSWMFQVDNDDEDGDEPQKPLLDELEIDVNDIAVKVRWALYPPPDGVGVIQDFWGPVSVVMLYAALLVWGQLRVVSWIFTIWACGSAWIFFVARVLGADLSFSHILGSLGYCVLPLVVMRLLLVPLGTAGKLSLIVRVLSVAWATYCGSRWILTADLSRKRALLVFPIFLYMFYFTALATGI